MSDNQPWTQARIFEIVKRIAAETADKLTAEGLPPTDCTAVADADGNWFIRIGNRPTMPGGGDRCKT